jgi:hypothetical protein
MKKKYLKIFLLLLIVGGSTLFLTGCSSKDDVEYDESKVKIIDLDEDEEEEIEESEQEEVEEEEEEDTNTDYSNFSRDRQVVGEESETEYTMTSLTDESMSGYHRFTFTLEAKDDGEDLPYVIVDYRSTLGSIRVDLNGVTTDNSGIAYQGSRSVNKEGIARIYHNISSDQSEELYDIGVAESTPFYLYSEEVSDWNWNIVVDVKHPGESDLDIDLGSSEFSTDDQSIVGSVASEGAAVRGYSYSVTGGNLVFIWAVSGSTAKPIPSVSASLGSDGILDVEFESLTSDKVSSAVSSISLPSGIIFTYSEGAYHFEIGANSEFKLSASTSPNQVELAIEL